MAITPAPGYQIDPNNPNAVIPIGTAAQAQGLGMYNTGTTPTTTTSLSQQPIAQAQPSPAPQQTTPAAPVAQPQPTTQINIGTPQATQPTTQPQTPSTGQNTASGGTLAMPANGSVVDLLNAAGQDSSFAARQKLAQQYGIQGYTGTAAQNQDLSKKYLEAYNANKGTTAPQSGAEATSALNDYFQQNQQEAQQDPIKQFMDTFGSMNPIEANIFQQLSGLLSSTNKQQSLTDLYAEEVAKQGIPALQLDLANITKIMDGSEDDIRAEITSTGGFATESQVQALVGARNKTLIRQANYLQNAINAKNDYVDRIVSLTQADRKQVSEDLDRKLGIAKMVADLSETMQNNARQNYQSIINSVGWGGLAEMVGKNPAQAKMVESLFGLGNGDLSALATYKKPLSEMEKLDLENQRLQNLKLQRDLSTGPGISTQVVEVNGKKLLINSKTGQTIAEIGGGTSPSTVQFLASQQQTIADTGDLLKSPGLNSAVGPNVFSRIPIFDAFGAQSNFIAGVEQLRQQLTLDQLIKSKGQGATFGALSDSELQLVAASASKLGTWAVKDKAGNVTGYSASETDFKKELDKINNFQKLDFVLKGGDPASVGVSVMPDGTYWTKNSNGTYTKIQ